MKLGNKYLVLKRADIFNYLNVTEKNQLQSIVLKISKGRAMDKKKEKNFIVISDKIPELYDEVKELVEQYI